MDGEKKEFDNTFGPGVVGVRDAQQKSFGSGSGVTTFSGFQQAGRQRSAFFFTIINAHSWSVVPERGWPGR